MKTLRNLISILLVMLIYKSIAIAQVSVGEYAPDFNFTSTDGEQFTLYDHKGKVVFIFLFGNGCPSCIAFGGKTETDINAVYISNENFVAVGLDQWNSSSSLASVSSFRSQTGITYPLLIKAGEMGTIYGSTYDRLMVIDQNGILRHKGTVIAGNDIGNAINVIEEYLTTANTDGIISNSKNTVIGVFPNPSAGNSRLRFKLNEAGPVNLTVYNSLGKIISEKSEVFESGIRETELAASTFTAGIHFYRLELKTGEIMTGKFLVTR